MTKDDDKRTGDIIDDKVLDETLDMYEKAAKEKE